CSSGLSFFFQAEDGIRAFHVTGVQTCALPIYRQSVPDALQSESQLGWVMGFKLGFGLQGIWYGLTIGLMMSTTLLYLRYRAKSQIGRAACRDRAGHRAAAGGPRSDGATTTGRR